MPVGSRSPPHHAVDRKVGTFLHDPRKLRLLLGREPLLAAGAVAFGQPVQTQLVEAMHPFGGQSIRRIDC